MDKSCASGNEGTDTFKVWGVSENTNAFGLYGIRLMNRRGHFYEVGASYLHAPKKGEVIRVKTRNDSPLFGLLSFETSERKYPNAPTNVITAVWAIEKEA